MSGATVSLHGLSKAYGDGPPVVDSVDLEVAPGNLVALLGPSGCGKTTTLKIIAGLLEPDAGDVRFDGRSVLDVAPERRPVAMVFQKPLLFPHMTVGQNVGFGLRMRKVDRSTVKRRVEEMLALVRLPGMASRRVSELSGGQEQRVSLARALVIEPAVLLLDEPLSQLDASLRVEMRDLVRSVQRQVGVTTIFVTHDQEEAVVLADRIALMLDGGVRQYDRPEAFYRRPATLAVARFFGGRNLFPGLVQGGRFKGALGEVALAGGEPDGRGVLVVRQEAVEVVDGPLPGTIEVTIEEALHLGTHVRASARPAQAAHDDAHSGERIHLTADPTRRLAPGDQAFLRLPPEHCHVVPASD